MGVGDAAALADGAEDVDLVLVSADLARCGLGGVVGAVAVPGAGFGLGLRVVGVAGFGLRVVGVAGFGLRVVGVDGVAHGLAVDGDGVVGAAAVDLEALQGAVELAGADAHQDVADDELAGHLVAAVPVPAWEPLAGARGQVLGPLGHGPVAARAAQRGAVGDGEHRGQRVAPALAAAGVVDVGEAVGQRTHGVGGDHGFRASVAAGGVERGAGQARPRVGERGVGRRPAWARPRRRCSRRARGGSRACARRRSSSRRGTPCRGSVPGRRRSPAAAADGRTAPASPPPGGARTAPAPASPGSARAGPAGSGSGCCWRAGAGGRTECGSPSRSSGRGRRTSAPAPRSRPAPPTRRANARRTTASRRSSAARPGSGAPPSGAGSALRPSPPPAPRQPRPAPRRCPLLVNVRLLYSYSERMSSIRVNPFFPRGFPGVYKFALSSA